MRCWSFFYLASVFRLIGFAIFTCRLFVGKTSVIIPDDNEIPLHIITTCSNIQVTRIKNVVTKDKMS